MATYYPGSNDTAQTLHLLNPNYGAYADTPAGNMILMNPDEPQHNHQHHFIGIPFPQLSQHQTMTSPSSAQQHRQALMSAAAAAATANPYSMWRSNGAAAAGGGGGELMFMRENSSSGSGSSLPVNQLNNESSSNAISSSHQHHQHQHQQAVGGVGMGMSVGMGVGVGDISSQLGLRKHQPPPSISSYQDPSSLQHSLSLQTDNPHTHTQPPTANPTHGLSLSLSPQQPSYHSQDSDMSCPAISATSEDNNRKWNNHNLNNNHNNFREPAPSSRDVGSEFQQAPFVGYKVQVDTGGGITGVPLSSKYLRAAQLLLDEVVSVGKGLKLETGKANKNSSSWIGGGENSGNNEGKDEGSAADLSPAERQELQMKKSKLVAMLDEVDQRYRQYYHQMQIVVQSFEAAAGYGAAKTYTALALQTISRHFRCLRDAITGQIKMASKSLGDEDSSGSGKGETTRLRFVDQQLRQQRALQQLGMIQQHAWRPQRGLPERSVSVLRTWLFEHFLHPYPKDADKHMLAKKTGLTRSQVSNWFINARVRLWKPMVEEMYLEELKENEGDRGNEKSGKESNEKKDDSLSKEATSGYEQQINANNNVNNANDSLSPEGPTNNTNSKSETTSNMINMRNQAFGMGESQIFSELESEGMRQGQLKKPRSGIHESLLPPNMNMNMEVDLKTEEDSDRAEYEETHKFSDDRQEDFGLLHNAMVHPDTSGNFGSYQLADLSRFGQGSFTPRFNGNNGVSLTLGLQHADGLSLQGTQHSFLSPQSLALGRRHDLGGNSSSDYCNIESSTAHPTSIYESLGLQHPKRYATQLMH